MTLTDIMTLCKHRLAMAAWYCARHGIARLTSWGAAPERVTKLYLDLQLTASKPKLPVSPDKLVYCWCLSR